MIVNDEATLKKFINLHNNIKNGRSNKTAMLVKYYMDGCPACINFQDEWNKAASSSPHKHVQFVKLNSNFMNRAKISTVAGFPTVRLITASGEHTFDEDRTAENLLGFILKHSGKKSRMQNLKGQTRKRRIRKGRTRKGRTRKRQTRKGQHGGSSRSRRGGSKRSRGGDCGCSSKNWSLW